MINSLMAFIKSMNSMKYGIYKNKISLLLTRAV